MSNYKNSIIKETVLRLYKLYPEAKPELDFKNAFELLIAAILSAQCTDVRVNKVTMVLFEKYKTPMDFISLSEDELSEIIRSCGLYKTKSRNIINTCKLLSEQYDGNVPNDFEKLCTLPGVGRKVANVIMSNAFGVPSIAVDTHVFRVSNRLGLVNADNVLKTEMQLRENTPSEVWSKLHHMLIFHGRRVCKAKNPNCLCCGLSDLCETNKSNKKE